MNPRHDAARDLALLAQLVIAVKGLRIGDLESGKAITLTCPCGQVILHPTLTIPSVRDRHRGMLKKGIEHHLWDDHGTSRDTIARVLTEACAEG